MYKQCRAVGGCAGTSRGVGVEVNTAHVTLAEESHGPVCVLNRDILQCAVEHPQPVQFVVEQRVIDSAHERALVLQSTGGSVVR